MEAPRSIFELDSTRLKLKDVGSGEWRTGRGSIMTHKEGRGALGRELGWSCSRVFRRRSDQLKASRGRPELNEGRRGDEVVGKPREQSRVARLGVMTLSRSSPSNAVFGPDWKCHKLGYTMDSSLDGKVTGMGKDGGRNSGGNRFIG